MAASRRWILLLILLAAPACRRDPSHLDDVQKMAYIAKPAVARVNAYATARFVCSGDVVGGVGDELRRNGMGIPSLARGGTFTFDTGAGGSGSGFVVHPDGIILTSGHVVARTRDGQALRRDLLRNGAIAALVSSIPVDRLRSLYHSEVLERYIERVVAAGDLQDIHIVNEVELSNGDKLPFRIERFSPDLASGGSDLAILRVSRKNLPSLKLGDSDAVRVGESIWAVGYPAVASSTDEVIGGWLSRDSDLEATVNPGTITAIKRNAANTPVFQSNVAIYRGNSGGPAVNREGEVIAISTWGRADAEQIKFLVPINVARAFLSAARIELNGQGEFDRLYRTALDAASEGNWTLASAQLERASALFPHSPDVIRFEHDAERVARAMPFWRKHPVALSAIGIAAMAVLLLIVVPAIRRPRLPSDLLRATTETVVSPSSLPPGQSRLLGRFTILNGTRAGEKLGLGGSGIRIGRESGICEIVLENPKVSRLHAEVVSIDGKVLLIDRNSSNGTFVNDQKIDKRFLSDGDIIYFGGRNAVAVAFHA
ncbi:MAG: trypsin-like peptidase domain-containing protein [Thermoanaerobaculia bacterium]